jgi:RNA polymerase sigma factor (sigma-70 family)
VSPATDPAAPPEPTVYVIDDDDSIRELLAWLMQRNRIRVETFADARSFFGAWRDEGPSCLVLDLHLPDMNGLEVQRLLIDRGVTMPVIFLSGRADVPRAVHAVKSGAVDFIEKPFDYKRIVALVQESLGRDAERRAGRDRLRRVAQRMATLTQREREVLDRVVAGKMNREIAEALDISIKTVEAHRSRIMEKLEVGSVAELVQAAMAAGAGGGTGAAG